MRYLLLFLTIVLLFMHPDSSAAEEMVTVKLVNKVGETSQLNFELKGGYFSFDSTLNLQEGVRYTLTVLNDNSLLLKGAGNEHKVGGSLVLIPEKYDKKHQIYINETPYLGAVEFSIENKKFIRPINQLPLEDYLKGVVPLEVYPSWGIETLKAQTLAARTYAMSHVSKTMDDTTQFQVYGGYAWSKDTTRAVNETAGEVITYKDQLINAFYSASNGGVTENNTHVWGEKPMSYLPIKEDPYDPVHPWVFTLHQTQIKLKDINWDNPDWWGETEEKDEPTTSSMKRWLQKKGYTGDIKILSIPHFELSNQTLKSGRRVKGSITIEFLQRLVEGTVLFQQLELKDVRLDNVRPLIGGLLFKSYFIDSLKESDGVYTMKGKGFGHGVGMSQWGAHYMGLKGKTYKQIIQFYYPKTSIMELTDYKSASLSKKAR
ncbi:SpoIID/LytB domain-containing protein [Virgibacillus sp. DJP39]|uniref:SpoIID/LytB domain-containing protein n=1 Tax=Virgibacillus sp. DJP39 TaxID=3409790 RepID=UPI003BB663D8